MKFGEKNVGELDRIARALLGVVFLGAFAMGLVVSFWSYIILAAGIMLLATAYFQTCGIYTLLACSTCEAKKK